MKNKKPLALLVGNDINSVGGGYKWNTLLEDLVKLVEAEGKIEVPEGQFPLFYEELWAYASSNKTCTEDEIKKSVAESVQRLAPNSVHSAVIGSTSAHSSGRSAQPCMEGIAARNVTCLQTITIP